MAPRLTPQARQLIAAQRGVLARWQLASIGLTARQLHGARRHDWAQLGPSTFLTTLTDPTPAQLRTAGALEAGRHGALTGCSALIEAGWTGQDDGHVDVLAARGGRSRRVRLPDWLRLHTTVEVPRRGGAPPRVTPSRAVVDAASLARSPRERLFIVASAVQQGLVGPDQITHELAARGRVAHAREVREILADLQQGVTTTGEADFLRQCRARGLPRPRMQVRRSAGGRRRRVDAEFRLGNGRIVMVEIDGAGHLDVGQWQDDLQRQNDLVVGTDALVLHVTTWQVRHDPDPFFDLLCSVVLPLL